MSAVFIRVNVIMLNIKAYYSLTVTWYMFNTHTLVNKYIFRSLFLISFYDYILKCIYHSPTKAAVMYWCQHTAAPWERLEAKLLVGG